MSSYFISCIAIFCIISLADCQCQFEQDMDYFGNDLSTNFVYYATQDLCCAACQANPLCQAWTYLPSTTACWLKRQIGSLRVSSPGSRHYFFFINITQNTEFNHKEFNPRF